MEMGRTARASQGGYLYQVLNRGNGRADVFYKDEDFAAFVSLMQEAREKVPMRLVGYCLMTNHFHLLLWPHGDGDLSRWMQCLMTAHVRRYHRHYKGSGHVWQGRFKAFPIQDDEHYLTVMRYVERNLLRANLFERSQDWEWSSLKPTERSGPAGHLSEGPIAKPALWTRFVNGVEIEAELRALRQSVTRGTPIGDVNWQNATANQLGIEASMRPRGRPRLQADGDDEDQF
jgi:putative transposase